jgi:hypothetical protein
LISPTDIAAGVGAELGAALMARYAAASWNSENPETLGSKTFGPRVADCLALYLPPVGIVAFWAGAFMLADGFGASRLVELVFVLLAVCGLVLALAVPLLRRPRWFVLPRYRNGAGEQERRTVSQGPPIGVSLGAVTQDPGRAVERALSDAGFATDTATIGGHEVVVMRRADFRLRWGAIRLHTSVFLFALEGLTQRDAKALTTSARQYAIDHKTGLKAGMGTGTLSVPVFLCANADDAAKRWFTHELAPRVRRDGVACAARPRDRIAVLLPRPVGQRIHLPKLHARTGHKDHRARDHHGGIKQRTHCRFCRADERVSRDTTTSGRLVRTALLAKCRREAACALSSRRC